MWAWDLKTILCFLILIQKFKGHSTQFNNNFNNPFGQNQPFANNPFQSQFGTGNPFNSFFNTNPLQGQGQSQFPPSSGISGSPTDKSTFNNNPFGNFGIGSPFGQGLGANQNPWNNLFGNNYNNPGQTGQNLNTNPFFSSGYSPFQQFNPYVAPGQIDSTKSPGQFPYAYRPVEQNAAPTPDQNSGQNQNPPGQFPYPGFNQWPGVNSPFNQSPTNPGLAPKDKQNVQIPGQTPTQPAGQYPYQTQGQGQYPWNTFNPFGGSNPYYPQNNPNSSPGQSQQTPGQSKPNVKPSPTNQQNKNKVPPMSPETSEPTEIEVLQENQSDKHHPTLNSPKPEVVESSEEIPAESDEIEVLHENQNDKHHPSLVTPTKPENNGPKPEQKPGQKPTVQIPEKSGKKPQEKPKEVSEEIEVLHENQNDKHHPSLMSSTTAPETEFDDSNIFDTFDVRKGLESPKVTQAQNQDENDAKNLLDSDDDQLIFQ